jgi:hypothetical protein
VSDTQQKPDQLTALQKLEVMVGVPKIEKVMIDGEEHEIRITHIKLGMIPKVVHEAGSLMLYLQDPSVRLDFKRLYLLHSNECLNLLAVLIRKDRAFVDELDLEQGVSLLMKVVEMNIDFFVRRVLPMFSGELQRIFVNAKETADKIRAITGSDAFSTSANTATKNTESTTTHS